MSRDLKRFASTENSSGLNRMNGKSSNFVEKHLSPGFVFVLFFFKRENLNDWPGFTQMIFLDLLSTVTIYRKCVAHIQMLVNNFFFFCEGEIKKKN